jgi:hypothetical protein
MWSNDATVGIEARGDPRTPTIAHRPPKLKVLKRRSFHLRIPREDSVKVNTALSAQHRSLSSTPVAGITGTARAGERGTDVRPNCLRRTPFPPYIHKF